MSSESKGVWAGIGKVAVVLTILWIVIQMYGRFVSTDVAISAEGSCEKFSVPQSYKNKLKELGDLATWDDVRKLFPETLKDGDSIATVVRRLLIAKTESLDKAFSNFESIQTTCTFTLSNTGNKEAQDIKLEIPRNGVYSLARLGEPDKEDKFDKVISIGKLNPGGQVIIRVWNTDYKSEIYPFEYDRFRVTHTNGITQVEFLPKNTTALGSLYETYPTIIFLSLLLLGGGIFLLGWKAGVSEEKKKNTAPLETTTPSNESDKKESEPPASPA